MTAVERFIDGIHRKQPHIRGHLDTVNSSEIDSQCI